jgi:hypothetical protein
MSIPDSKESALTEECRAEEQDIVVRLRDTPNWMRESFGHWKSCTKEYDRAPFDAAVEIERLRAINAELLEALQDAVALIQNLTGYQGAKLWPAGEERLEAMTAAIAKAQA